MAFRVRLFVFIALSAGAVAPAGAQALAPSSSPVGQDAVRARVEGERKACRAAAVRTGASGDALHAAMIDCVAKVDPIAGRRMACARAALQRGVAPADMPLAVHSCMNGAI